MEQNRKPNYIEFYPVGTVVIVKGNIKKLAVIARGIMTEIRGELCYFDYAGVLYPEGLINSQLIYFNHKDILKVVYKGYEDEDEAMMKDNVNEWIAKSNIRQGSPYELNVSKMLEHRKGGEKVDKSGGTD